MRSFVQLKITGSRRHWKPECQTRYIYKLPHLLLAVGDKEPIAADFRLNLQQHTSILHSNGRNGSVQCVFFFAESWSTERLQSQRLHARRYHGDDLWCQHCDSICDRPRVGGRPGTETIGKWALCITAAKIFPDVSQTSVSPGFVTRRRIDAGSPQALLWSWAARAVT